MLWHFKVFLKIRVSLIQEPIKKDTESKNIDSMNSVFIVMKINCSVTAEQNSALTASLEEKSLGCWLFLGMTVWTTRVCCGIPFPVCAPGCPLGPWAGWCAECERSFWPQVWWTQAARRVCRPGSAPQPWQGSPAGARYKCWSDTSENRRNRSKNINTSMKQLISTFLPNDLRFFWVVLLALGSQHL